MINMFNVGIYIRLSKEDLNKDNLSNESYSVQNQKLLLENYVRENKYNLVETYVDDGYTGTNFDRPAFKKMIFDIENKKINMVVTKDMSRLGRDYIETGKYIEKYFPINNIRYVSILDGIDTFSNISNNDIAPFKAIINDMYSKDNSKKIKSALMSLKLEGKWVGGCTPLGYKTDSNNKNHLVIEEKEASIVRKIFSYALKGMSDYQIKECLIKEKVPTATMLRNRGKKNYNASNGIWSSKTINTILKNQIYTGDVVQNKRSRISYKVRKLVSNSKKEWIIISNMHEAIIDKKTFYKVQQLLENRKVKSKKSIYRLLDGILYCADCNHRITICKPRKKDNKTYIVCNTYKVYSKQKLCTPHSNNYDKLEQKIIDSIRELFERLDKTSLEEKAINIYNRINSIDNYNKKIDNINTLINIKKEQIDNAYIDKLESKISDEMYDRIKKRIDQEITNYIEDKKNLIKSLNKYNSKKVFNKLKKFTDEFINVKYPSKYFVLGLINKIEIHKDKQIDIYFNFKKLSY